VPDTVLWLRRDLRLADHPALLAAAEQATGGRVLPLFVLDPRLLRRAGDARTTWLLRSLAALTAAADGALVLRSGLPHEVVPQVVRELGAAAVHVSADPGPFGRRRDDAVQEALEVPLVRTGTPYAVGPGSVTKPDGSPYAVFTPFSRAWREHGWPAPAAGPPPGLRWAGSVQGEDLPAEPAGEVDLPTVGEQAAHERWREFLDTDVDGYADGRNRPDLPATSRMSAHLKYGEIHPRTMLADLARRRSKGAGTYRGELTWREFYADVVWHRPRSAWDYLRPQFARMRYDEPGARFEAWRAGRTGFPFVDAGMRQLVGAGWMHNRLRMVTASFLVKDLHVEWQHGARHFLDHLVDGDLASNNHGWQWTAGSGTDAAPYFRVFNPVTQGQKFDPDGEYVRRWVPELRHLPGKAAHTPWDAEDGYADGYPERVVDHAAERQVALDRYAGISA